MTNIKNRIFWVDGLKAFLIYLVVLGHCIQYTCSTYNENLVFYIIYSFHMPLFMFVSGFVSYKETVKMNVIVRRFVQLMIPFFFYTILGAIVKQDIRIFIDTCLYPERGLWFLWALFFIVLLNTCGKVLSQGLRVSPLIGDIIVFVFLAIAGHCTDLYGIATIAKFYLYYTIGLYVRKFEGMVLKEATLKPILFMTMILWATLVCLGINNTIGVRDNTIYKLCTAFAGIMCFVTLFKCFIRKYNQITQSVGGGTLGIYALHWFFLWAININPFQYEYVMYYYLFMIISSVVLLTMSYLLVSLFRKNKITSLLFIGERK